MNDLLSTQKERTAIRRRSGETHFSRRRGKTMIWHKKSNSNDPAFWFQMGRNRIRRHMRHMNLISTRKKVHRKHTPRTILVARPNMMWETDFTKIYIDSEGWVYLTAYLDLCSRKIKCSVSHTLRQTGKTIKRQFPPFHLPFFSTYCFPSLLA